MVSYNDTPMVSKGAIRAFQDTVRQHYELYGRHDLPWRRPEANGAFDPYRILVSEIMLQQTQVPRVIPKYLEFLTEFPDINALAAASLGDVLRAWSGLGYNRRAKFLWQAGRQVQKEYDVVLPDNVSELTRLPGVGKNTAGAVLAYAFDRPEPFVETNIRTVFIYHFFPGEQGTTDAQILEILSATLPRAGSREWYWALMDYGTFLKQAVANLNKLSKTYSKQSLFEGSRRQLRGKIIRLLGQKPLSKANLQKEINDERLNDVLADLLHEEMIRKTGGMYDLH